MTPYQEAMLVMKQNFGTGSAAGMAKLILSLYNAIHSFSLGECLDSFDRDNRDLAVRMIQYYVANGEDEALREVGREVYEKWPNLIELSNAASDAKAEVRQRWSREEEARSAPEYQVPFGEIKWTDRDGSPYDVSPGQIAATVINPERNCVSEYGKPLTIHQFCKSLAANYEGTTIFHVGNGRWVPRCDAGVLLIKNVAPYTCLEDALADLASVGIRRIPVEWDGFAASKRATEEPK